MSVKTRIKSMVYYVIYVYHKYSFFVKNVLSLILILVSFLLRARAISFALIRILWIIFGIPLLFLFLVGVVPTIKQQFNASFPTNIKIKLNKDTKKVAYKMGVDVTHYYRLSNTNNAAVSGNKVFVGDRTETIMTDSELTAILAHEFSHIKYGKLHTIVLAFGWIIYCIITYLLTTGLPRTFAYLLASAFTYLFFHQILWYRELHCDENAVKYVLVEDLQNALINMAEGKIHTYSFAHPSISYRVQNLGKRK